MKYYSLGYVEVFAGSPQNLSAFLNGAVNSPTDPAIRVHIITFEPLAANTSISFVGLANFNKTSGVGVLHQMNPQSSSGKSDAFCIESCEQSNGLNLADYAIDGNHTGDLILVTYGVL